MAKQDPGRNPANAAELAQLREAVRDLAARQEELADRLSTVLTLLEGLREGLDPPGADDLAWPAAPPPRTSPQERLRELWRLARWAAGRFVRLVRGRNGAPPGWSHDLVELVRGDNFGSRPSLAVILEAEDAGEILADQTDLEFSRWTHDVRGSGFFSTDAKAARSAAALGADYLLTIRGETSDLPATLIETGRLVLAVEALDVLCVKRDRGAAFWVRPELWDATGLDGEALAALAKRSPGRVLGKVVDLGSRADVNDLLEGRNLRATGPYRVAARGAPRTIRHPLAKLAERGITDDEAGRRSVLVLVLAPLTGELVRTLAALVEALAGEARFLMAVGIADFRTADTGADADDAVRLDELDLRRLRALAEHTPYVYLLPGFFAPMIWPEVIAHLASSHGVDRVLHVGSGAGLLKTLRQCAPKLRLIDLPLHPSAPANDADLHLALTAEIEAARRGRDGPDTERVVRIPLGFAAETPLSAGPLTAERQAELRSRLGYRPRDVLVVMVSDLVVEARPEDFVALAHRFRDDERFAFLLIGEGPLEATVLDLRRCLGATNLEIRRPSGPTADDLAAADLVCSTAESAPFASIPIAALSLGRPVLAYAAGDLPELLADGPCGVSVSPIGDVTALVEALRELADPEARQALGARGREVAGRSLLKEEALRAYRRALIEP